MSIDDEELAKGAAGGPPATPELARSADTVVCRGAPCRRSSRSGLLGASFRRPGRHLEGGARPSPWSFDLSELPSLNGLIARAPRAPARTARSPALDGAHPGTPSSPRAPARLLGAGDRAALRPAPVRRPRLGERRPKDAWDAACAVSMIRCPFARRCRAPLARRPARRPAAAWLPLPSSCRLLNAALRDAGLVLGRPRVGEGWRAAPSRFFGLGRLVRADARASSSERRVPPLLSPLRVGSTAVAASSRPIWMKSRAASSLFLALRMIFYALSRAAPPLRPLRFRAFNAFTLFASAIPASPAPVRAVRGAIPRRRSEAGRVLVCRAAARSCACSQRGGTGRPPRGRPSRRRPRPGETAPLRARRASSGPCCPSAGRGAVVSAPPQWPTSSRRPPSPSIKTRRTHLSIRRAPTRRASRSQRSHSRRLASTALFHSSRALGQAFARRFWSSPRSWPP